jgi:hypothetical protein
VQLESRVRHRRGLRANISTAQDTTRWARLTVPEPMAASAAANTAVSASRGMSLGRCCGVAKLDRLPLPS